ncbi:MexE family multidrug efflux RND transporter periplasmic adaptor subunit [Cellvibrio zantedeschiae]|uniref:MexE family multidrug efflux RND transporter periplasmic adaptor subunit n=1 Tax=Cellvibrio zantedeschiae TaxID=1237077 RepID=A0ABQ3B1V4_9GAMM|nr:efflux RND transporter periplasmic adaptor subunit [Cellvibrio zantedeschiae]GGY73969.1 MexE family multidrug efflux RND transporter periplasmic adaptor subunit [Cellvibrio zantedeschiae]
MSSAYSRSFSRKTYQISIAAILSGIAGFYYVIGANAAAPAAAPPAPTVDVVVVQPQQIRTWANFSGRLSPVESAAIKPLVSGTIQQVLFKDGEQVKKGHQLFVIDPRPHQASVQRAQAQLATAQSRAKLARDELNRAQQLITAKLVSQSIYDSAVSNDQVAQAAVNEADAALNQAKLNLEYAHISAPISGRISRAELTVGNVVEAGPNAPQLAQIIASDKLYAEFNVDEATYIQFVRNTKSAEKMPVELTLASAANVTYQGYITAFDNRLDTTSGTIRARAVFDNNDGALTAGMFANVRLGSAEKLTTLLVPERAIGTNQSKKFVLVVDEKNLATYHEITLGDHYQGQRIVLNGINAGDKVIVNGLSHVRPNTVVNPSVEKPAAQVALNP